MSNAVKMVVKEKKPEIDDWKAVTEKLSYKLRDRLYDQIILADNEASDEGMPEEIADCMIMSVLVLALVDITRARKIVGPDALLKLIEGEIKEHQK